MGSHAGCSQINERQKKDIKGIQTGLIKRQPKGIKGRQKRPQADKMDQRQKKRITGSP
jgi:hypothetical protein